LNDLPVAAGQFSLFSPHPTSSLESSVHDLHVAVQLARIEAASRNRECRIELNSHDHSVRIYDGQGTARTADDQLLHQLSLPSGFQLTHSNLGASPILQFTFSPDGGVDRTTLIGLDDTSRHGRILIHPSGTISINLS
jgi:hypothetical protein